MASNPLRVAHPPPRPLLVWDGDCRFCAGWIRRWRAISDGRVDYATYQETGARFPELTAADYAQAVHLILPDGTVLRGAEAAFVALAPAQPARALLALYRRAPLFARASEAGYRFVARRRMVFSWITKIFWGDPAPSTYRFSGMLFTRMMGLAFLLAFLSFWAQADGLVGAEGIIPLKGYFANLAAAAQAPENPGRFWLAPSLLWLAPDNAGLHALLAAGSLCALLAMAGLLPAPALLGCVLAYGSLRNGVPVFLNFQWDALILEAGLAGALLAPWRGWENPRTPREPPRAGRWAAWWLLFKLMFLSGLVKILTNGGGPAPAHPGAVREFLSRLTGVPVGENRWLDGTALQFHYFTQPLPNGANWWFHHRPEWFHEWSLWGTMFAELAVPFLFFAPRRLRHGAALVQIALQFALLLSGNYGFFNLLTLALCVPLLDDAFWPARVRKMLGPAAPATAAAPRRPLARAAAWVRGLVVAGVIFIGLVQIQEAWAARSGHEAAPPATGIARVLHEASLDAQRLGLVNSYGLFRVMTTERPEIVISGSNDGVDWKPYAFYFKPGDVARAPRSATPHMPRLDWQMWFAGLDLYYGRRLSPWVPLLLEQMLRGNPTVLSLFEHNPFPDAPPRFLQLKLYRYHFTTPEELARTGAWWTATPEPAYTITTSRRQ